MKFALFFAILFSALVITFSLQNSQLVQVQFLHWYFEGALVFVLLLTFAIGLLAMMGLTFMESGGVPNNLPLPSGYLHEWLAAGIILAGALAVTVGVHPAGDPAASGVRNSDCFCTPGAGAKPA